MNFKFSFHPSKYIPKQVISSFLFRLGSSSSSASHRLRSPNLLLAKQPDLQTPQVFFPALCWQPSEQKLRHGTYKGVLGIAFPFAGTQLCWSLIALWQLPVLPTSFERAGEVHRLRRAVLPSLHAVQALVS